MLGCRTAGKNVSQSGQNLRRLHFACWLEELEHLRFGWVEEGDDGLDRRAARFQAVELVHHNDDILHLWWEGVLYPSTNDRDVLRASLLLAEADHDLRPDGTA